MRTRPCTAGDGGASGPGRKLGLPNKFKPDFLFFTRGRAGASPTPAGGAGRTRYRPSPPHPPMGG
jgi:hypothetical protein